MTGCNKVNNRINYYVEERLKVKMIYCCEEHVDIALDTIVDDYETFPVLSKVDGDNLSTNCEYCQNSATYVVANK
jgi:CxxH/CxxC protein (TIGR04129 family)